MRIMYIQIQTISIYLFILNFFLLLYFEISFGQLIKLKLECKR